MHNERVVSKTEGLPLYIIVAVATALGITFYLVCMCVLLMYMWQCTMKLNISLMWGLGEWAIRSMWDGGERQREQERER